MKTGKKYRGIHSLQFRFFSCIALASAIFVIVMLLLNLLFFQQYYLLQKKAKLTDTYKQIYLQYNTDIDIPIDTLQELENRYGIRISILNTFGQSVYDTIYQHDRESRISSTLMDPFGRSIYVYDEAELQEKGYTFSRLNEVNGKTSSIALIGMLKNHNTILLRIPTTALQEDQSVNFIFLIFSGLIALLVCLICGYLIGRNFTRPISEMTEVADSIARLDFSKKYTGKDRDELGELGRSLNQMSDILESSIEEMQQMNAQLQREIEEKQHIDDMRREFIVNISHDLKTPIALIQGYAEGLRVGINESEEDKNDYCDIIIDEAKRMNHLVRQLLDLSRIELGNTVPNLSEFDAY